MCLSLFSDTIHYRCIADYIAVLLRYIVYVYRLSWFFGDFVTTNCRCIDVYRDSVTIYRRDRDLVDGPVTGAGQCRGHGSLLVGYDRFWLWLLRQHLHYINIKLRKFCTFKSILTSRKLLLTLGLRKKILFLYSYSRYHYYELKGNSSQEEESNWLIGSIVATVVMVIVILVLLVMRKRIGLVGHRSNHMH